MSCVHSGKLVVLPTFRLFKCESHVCTWQNVFATATKQFN